MTVVVRDRFGREPGPGGQGELGSGPCAVIVIGGRPYEVRRGDLPNTWLLARVGACYTVWLGTGGCWSCSCPSATYRREAMCKHAAALAALCSLFREVTCSTEEGG
jgi:hypothetical protein